MSPTSHKFGRALARAAQIAAVIVLSAVLGACDSSQASKTVIANNNASDKSADPSSKKQFSKTQRATILKTLADENASEDARLDSIHSARDLQLADAIPELRKSLKSDNADIVVAAAAALDGLNAKDADLALIEAAGHLGRARQFEHLRQLLYIIGSVGGPRARTYLETVAEGHELPPIRDTAAQILKDSSPDR